MTTQNVNAIYELDSSKARLKWRGVAGGTAAANSATTFDFIVPNEMWVDGAEYVLCGGTAGDSLTQQVIHPELGVVGEYGESVYVLPDSSARYTAPYVALIPPGMILRFIYTNVHASQAADVYFNVCTHTPIY
jgi:hypothetical protein